jgi:hypothetical protein
MPKPTQTPFIAGPLAHMFANSHNMNTRNIYRISHDLKIILIISVLFFSINSSSLSQVKNLGAQDSERIDKQIIVLIRNFYIEYINQCDKSNYDTLMSIRQKYCTKNLLDRIYNRNDSDILDYDPFLKAQDCDKRSIQTLRIWKDNKNPSLFFVSYIWPSTQEKTVIKIIIKRDTFRIDSLPDMYSKNY